MKKLYRVTCCGSTYLGANKRESIYTIAEDEKEASERALNKMKELEYYDKIDDYVSNVELIADEKDYCKSILII